MFAPEEGEVMITVKEVLAAQNRIGPFIHKTPLMRSSSLSEATGADVFIKAENLQKTGAFKVRGAFNKMIGMNEDAVITASMGNHAQAVAFAARETGIKAKIVMPVVVSIIKEEATRGYGAEVILKGADLGQSLDFALSQKQYPFIHPFDDDAVIAGQGTIGLEIMDELNNVDAILVPVGGGGLVAGVGAAVKALSPSTQIIGVVTESAPAAYRSFLERKLLECPPRPTVADGVKVGKLGDRPFRMIIRYVDDIILVAEDMVALGVLLLMERAKMVVEGAGALPLAALLSHKERFKGKRVVLVASGGNIDFTVIDRIVRRGLVTNGRIVTFDVVADDIPGNLRDLTSLIAGLRANILDVSHNRLTQSLPLEKTLVTFTIEVRSREDGEALFARLRAKGFVTRDSSRFITGATRTTGAIDDVLH
jgi:threonine dehydratase